MSHRIHSLARTTPNTRADIQASSLTERELVKKYSVTRSTIRK